MRVATTTGETGGEPGGWEGEVAVVGPSAARRRRKSLAGRPKNKGKPVGGAAQVAKKATGAVAAET